MKTNIKMKISLSLVLLCLVSCIILLIGIPTTLAFFSGTVASKDNVISTGKYDAYVYVDGESEDPTVKEVSVEISGEPKTVYVKKAVDSTAPGYCEITTMGSTYYATADTVTITVNQNATITVTPHWGALTGKETVTEITVGTLSALMIQPPVQETPPEQTEVPDDTPETTTDPVQDIQPEETSSEPAAQ